MWNQQEPRWAGTIDYSMNMEWLQPTAYHTSLGTPCMCLRIEGTFHTMSQYTFWHSLNQIERRDKKKVMWRGVILWCLAFGEESTKPSESPSLKWLHVCLLQFLFPFPSTVPWSLVSSRDNENGCIFVERKELWGTFHVSEWILGVTPKDGLCCCERPWGIDYILLHS